MRAVIIGGSGHVGTYLAPRLVEAGYEVINVSRQQREPYQPHGAWQSIRQVQIDRTSAEAQGDFGSQIAALEADVVIDMICFTPESARQLVEALAPRVRSLTVGPSTDPESEMGPVVTADAKRKIISLIDKGVAEGAKLVVDGR